MKPALADRSVVHSKVISPASSTPAERNDPSLKKLETIEEPYQDEGELLNTEFSLTVKKKSSQG